MKESIIRCANRAFVFLLLPGLVACSSKTLSPTQIEDIDFSKTQTAIERFQEQPTLQRFFNEAYGFAIYPSAIRGGTGIGWTYGNGWVYKNQSDELLLAGKTITNQLNVGAQLGVQVYSLIIFFRDEKTYERFTRGSFEFAGQAYASALAWGGAKTPAYNSTVASFTQLKGGLLLEASVGAHRYDFIRIDY